eukprot:657517-Pelagomonas_calceolata.AAC.1
MHAPPARTQHAHTKRAHACTSQCARAHTRTCAYTRMHAMSESFLLAVPALRMHEPWSSSKKGNDSGNPRLDCLV